MSRMLAADDSEAICRRLAELRAEKTVELNGGCRCSSYRSMGIEFVDKSRCELHREAT